MRALPLCVTLPVLGLATRFETDSAEVLDIVHESFGAWSGMTADGAGEPLRVRVMLRPGGDAPSVETLRHLCPDADRVIVHSADCVAVSDPARREAVAYVTPALVARRAHFRTELLEAITLALACAFDRHPVHAAALVHEGRALLLSAPSGTGKSTLAYLARRAGIAVMSEDRVWVQRAPALRVWGWPGGIHLRDDAPVRFPELRAHAPTPYRHGPPRIVVGDGAVALRAERVTVCAVRRGGGRARLGRASGDELLATLDADVAAGFDRFPARHRDTMRAITRHGGWRLELSDDPHAALPLIHQMLADPN